MKKPKFYDNYDQATKQEIANFLKCLSQSIFDGGHVSSDFVECLRTEAKRIMGNDAPGEMKIQIDYKDAHDYNQGLWQYDEARYGIFLHDNKDYFRYRLDDLNELPTALREAAYWLDRLKK